MDDELVVAAGTGSRRACRRKIDLAELLNERWFLTAPDAWNQKHLATAFQSHGLDLPQISLRRFSVHLRTNLLATGSFITVLPRSVLRLDANLHLLKALPIKLPGLHWLIAIVTLKNRTLSPVVERFIERARAVAKSFSTQRVLSELTANDRLWPTAAQISARMSDIEAISGLVVLAPRFTGCHPGCVKTSSQVCVASQFAGAIDEAIR